MISIILVDDHVLYREGVRSVITKLSCYQTRVIGEAGSALEFFSLLSAGKIPDLVMLDIMLPDLSGVEIARRLKTEYPEIKIVMLSSEVTEELVTELLDIGVDGYLNKLARVENIQTALCTVIGGNQYYGRSVAKMMYDIYVSKQHVPKPPVKKGVFSKKSQNGSPKPIFTEREIEMINLLCDGKSIKEIADHHNISARTVEKHKSNILEKLGFSNLIGLVKYAIKEGIVEL